MKRRWLLTLAALLPFAAPARAAPLVLTAQDQADIARVEVYMNALHTLKARFLQVAADGNTAGGIAWLDRPGRMRFQYDPPSPLLLVAGHGLVVFHDAKLRQTSNFPLSSTPLGLLLRENVKLSGDITLLAISRQPGQLQVSVSSTNSPGDGNLTLVFADNPLALRQWIVVDSQRRETRVSLFDVELGGSFPQNLFTFIDPEFLAPGSNANGVGH